MATIWVIPLASDPILFNECPRGTVVGDVHIRWSELKRVHVMQGDAEVHCGCSEGIRCCSYVLNWNNLLAYAAELRAGAPSTVIQTLDAVVELKRLDLRNVDTHVRPRVRRELHAAVA